MSDRIADLVVQVNNYERVKKNHDDAVAAAAIAAKALATKEAAVGTAKTELDVVTARLQKLMAPA